MQLIHLRDLATAAPLASGHCFLSAASGLVVLGSHAYVVGDDAHHLGRFDLAGEAPGELIRLIEGDLPRGAKARKAVKPDFEVLLALPGEARLLALGSGSTPQRKRGVLVELAGGAPAMRPIDLQPLFAAIGPLVPEINLEGAVVEGEHLLLFNRGNMHFSMSQVIEVRLAGVLNGGPVKVATRAELALPEVSGVPLTVTDAYRLANGHVLLSAVAEATADSYADGALAGAAIVELDARFGIVAVYPLHPPRKVEGIALVTAGGRTRLLCVTDADDPAQPAVLLAADL